MSKQEKASWSLLITNLIIGVWYFSKVLSLGPDLAAQMGTMVGLYVKLITVAITVAIAGEIVMYAISDESPDKVAQDERDQLIRLKAQRNGHYVLVAVVIALLMALLMSIGFTHSAASGVTSSVMAPLQPVREFLQWAGQAIFMANLLFLALMLSEVAVQGSRVFYYRRGY